ncbi:MAG: orotidine-5'-phosphate decarboxylase [Thermoflexales bacterium]|nr:orotidine-5'-phosphate decarboxylase [Thermoflexales bacterium]
MNFFEALEKRAREVDSLLCVGIDPRGTEPNAVRDECFRLIDATAAYACAFKPNSAFFEALGAEGMTVLHDVIAHVPSGIPVILDAKRGDIADTAEAYARSAFDQLGAHAITLSPYLGGEALKPFLARAQRGAFVLCKTSNPGADEFQGSMLQDAGSTLYEVVAAHAQNWNTNGNVGLVVGATDPQALARVRSAAPDLWFLVPGIGAQGGDLQASLEAGLRPDGLGLLINVSRAIAKASDPGEAAKKMRDDINVVRGAWAVSSGTHHSSRIMQLAQDLITSQCVRFGQFKLKSGLMSPIYLDLRRLVTYPQILRRVAQAYAAKLNKLPFDRIAGIPYAALPIATAIALEMNRPLIYPRREAKDYGTKAVIEGDYVAGETIVVIDDLATTGGSKIEAIQKLEEANLKVRDIVVLIDRGQGAGPMLAEAGYRLHAVAALPELLDEWLRSGAISQEQFGEVKEFLTR